MQQNASSAKWFVICIGFVTLSLAFSTRSTLGLMMPLWQAEFGWTQTFMSSGGALALVVMSVIAPVAGWFVDRYGARPVIIAGIGLIAAAMFLLSRLDGELSYLLAFGGVAGVGFGVVAVHIIATAVAPMFERRRGLAIGVATAGASAGQLIVIPVFAVALTYIGWRNGYQMLGVAAVVVLLLAWLKMPRHHSSRDPSKVKVADPVPLRRQLGRVIRSSQFHALFWGFVICGFTTTGVIETHLLPYAIACGYPPLTSATAYGVLSAFNMLGMIVAGHLADRMHRPLLLAAIYVLRGLSFILLMYIADDLSLLFVFAVAFGLFDYSTVPVVASLVASHLGLKTMGLVMGLLAAGHALGGAVGAFLGGVLFDLFARYQEMWIASVVLAGMAAVITLTIKESPKEDSEGDLVLASAT